MLAALVKCPVLFSSALSDNGCEISRESQIYYRLLDTSISMRQATRALKRGSFGRSTLSKPVHGRGSRLDPGFPRRRSLALPFPLRIVASLSRPFLRPFKLFYLRY